MNTEVVVLVPPLPPELFYQILLELLVEYLHLLILEENGREQWNAFTVLPLVSRVFLSITNWFFVKLFGESEQDAINSAERSARLALSKALWARTKILPCPPWDPEAEKFSPEEIPRPYKPSTHSGLLGVYDSISRARFFFNNEAMHVESEDPMCHLRLWYPFMGQGLRICDDVFPRSLLKFVGPHLTDQTTYCYSHECVHQAKNALDALIKSSPFFDTENYVHQNIASLKGLEENKWNFLWLGGFISQTFPMIIKPTRHMLQSANILETLLAVADHEWQDKSLDIPNRARDLHRIYTTRIQET